MHKRSITGQPEENIKWLARNRNKFIFAACCGLLFIGVTRFTDCPRKFGEKYKLIPTKQDHADNMIGFEESHENDFKPIKRK